MKGKCPITICKITQVGEIYWMAILPDIQWLWLFKHHLLKDQSPQVFFLFKVVITISGLVTIFSNNYRTHYLMNVIFWFLMFWSDGQAFLTAVECHRVAEAVSQLICIRFGHVGFKFCCSSQYIHKHANTAFLVLSILTTLLWPFKGVAKLGIISKLKLYLQFHPIQSFSLLLFFF